jgi:hypothetical protein
MNTTASALSSLIAFAALSMAGTSTAAEPLNIEDVETMSATVDAIDVEKRLVSLRGPEGTGTYEVSPDVRNLAQVEVGDTLVVRYYRSMAAEIKPKGASTTLNAVDKSASGATAQPGSKPGGLVRSTVTTTVTIQSVDKKNKSVMFSGPDGLVRSVTAQRPEGQKFVSTLKKGDQVEMTYTEALAVSIETAE